MKKQYNFKMLLEIKYKALKKISRRGKRIREISKNLLKKEKMENFKQEK